MITISGLSVSYGEKRVLNDVSFALREREKCAVMGPSGAGKTTLLKVLAGIIKRYDGSVEYHKSTPLVGYVPQNYGLLNWKTVRDNIALPLKLKRAGNLSVEEAARELEIDELLNSFPGELSGGQKQRAALARAFAASSDLLLMDEPFSALDSEAAKKGEELFLRLWERSKVTALFVTHSAEEAKRLAERVLVLDKEGRLT